MKFLLDTHAFIWMDNGDSQLSSTVASHILNTDHEIFLSVASIWEMQIKIQLGKLHLQYDLDKVIEQQIANGIRILPILTKHIWALNNLPLFHRDPFDRMLIAQSKTENMAIFTRDALFLPYSVSTIW